MLEHLEAYKKFVDHEKEGLKRDLEASYAKDKDKLAQYEIWLDDMVSLFFELTPYVAQQDRKRVIESTRLSESAKLIMRRFADLIPDLSSQKQFMTWLEAANATYQKSLAEMRISEVLSGAQEKKS